MKNLLLFALLPLFFSCSSNNTPEPQVNNPYQKITEKDFIGTWIYQVSGEDYMKIVISQAADGLEFEHSEKTPSGWIVDKDVYPKQKDIKFFPYLTTSINTNPHLVVKSSYSSGTSRIDYVSDSRGVFLHLGVSGRYFKQ